MTRVKMNAKHEYEFIGNFKVLQNAFRQHKIEKVSCPFGRCHGLRSRPAAHPRREARQVQDAVRPTRFRSVVTRSQVTVSLSPSRDNLEFLQWLKRFWDTNYGGQGYDPVARRRGAPIDTPATIAPLAPSTSRAAGGLHAGGARAGGRTPVAGHRSGSTQPNEAVQNLQAQLREMNAHLEGLEKERDFYFAKVSTTSREL